MIEIITKYSFLLTFIAFYFVIRGQISQIFYLHKIKTSKGITMKELNNRIMWQCIFITSIFIRTPTSIFIRTPDYVLMACALIALILVLITRYLVKKYQ